MAVQCWLGIWNLSCCFSAKDNEKEPLVISSAKRSVKRTRKYLTGKRGLKDSIPLRKDQECTVIHTPLSRKRQFIINELVETERRYVERLSTLKSNFILPLVDLQSDCTPLNKLNIKVEQLRTFHTEFLEDLSEKCIPSVFNKKGDFLKLTQGYVNLHPEVSTVIETLRSQSKGFRKIIVNNELVHQVQLIALLIEPVQRIPRYQLLLDDLLANTPDGHPEFEDLEKALKKVEGIILTLNEAGHSSNGAHHMYSIYQRIRGRGSSLWVPSRSYICENVFWCVLKGEKLQSLPPSRVRVFLFSDCIVFCENQKIGRGYKFQDEISLCNISSLELVPNPHSFFKKHKLSTEVHGFELSAQGLRTVELYHSHKAVTKKWVELILKHRRENTSKKEKRESFIKSRLSTGFDPELHFGSRTNSKAMISLSVSDATSNYNSISNYGSISSSNAMDSPVQMMRTNSSSTASSLCTVIDRGRGCSISSNDSNKSNISKVTSSVENLLKLARRRSEYINLSESQEKSSIPDRGKTGVQVQVNTDNLNPEAQGEETVKEISPFVKRLMHEVTMMNNCLGRSSVHEVADATGVRLMDNQNEPSALGQLNEPSANSELLF